MRNLWGRHLKSHESQNGSPQWASSDDRDVLGITLGPGTSCHEFSLSIAWSRTSACENGHDVSNLHGRLPRTAPGLDRAGSDTGKHVLNPNPSITPENTMKWKIADCSTKCNSDLCGVCNAAQEGSYEIR
jgi:hypothetical protein